MMFDDLRDLYQEVILDHGRKPRNFRRLEGADRAARGDNPMCGDRMELWLKLGAAGEIADAAFQGRGCAISMASASLMTETVKGKGPEQAKAYVDDDLVVVLMRGGFARVEETLLEAGHGDAVIQQRATFQDVMRSRFAEIVEAETGREVVAFMSGSHQHPDLLAEIFVLGSSELARLPDGP